MDAAEIVVGEEQAESRFVVLPLLRVSIGEPSLVLPIYLQRKTRTIPGHEFEA
jgi:hypothetical protein